MAKTSVRDALVAYKTKVEELRLVCGMLSAAGLDTYKTSDFERSLARIQRHIEKLEGGETDAKFDALSDDLDDHKLGFFSWDNALESARGRAEKQFEDTHQALLRVIQLVQG